MRHALPQTDIGEVGGVHTCNSGQQSQTGPCARPSTLSPEECDALAIAGTGRTTAEVAEILGCSYAAASQMLGRAVLKLGANSKLEAVVLALRRGIITLPPE